LMIAITSFMDAPFESCWTVSNRQTPFQVPCQTPKPISKLLKTNRFVVSASSAHRKKLQER
jgi:hypothetical protein